MTFARLLPLAGLLLSALPSLAVRADETRPYYFSAAINPISLVGVDNFVPQSLIFKGEFGYQYQDMLRVRVGFGNRTSAHEAPKEARSLAKQDFLGTTGALSLLVDWFPLHLVQSDDLSEPVANLLLGLRVSTGATYFNSEMNLNHTHVNSKVRLGDVFTEDATSTRISASARYAWPVMPYLGLGFDFPVYQGESVFIGSSMDLGFFFGGGLKLLEFSASSRNLAGEEKPLPEGSEKEFDRVTDRLTSNYQAIFSFSVKLLVGIRF